MAEQEPVYYYDSSLTGPELDAALAKVAQLDQTLAKAETAATAAESWNRGGTATRAGEDTDNSRYWARQSATSAQNAAASATAAQTASQTAAASAQSAAVSATGAAQSAQTAREYGGHPPVIREGNWWLWDLDSQQYQDTGLPALLIDQNSKQNVRMWFGTVAEYNALDVVEPDVYYNLLEGTP